MAASYLPKPTRWGPTAVNPTCHFSAALNEQAVCLLHDVCFVQRSDLLALVVAGILEGVLSNTCAGHACDHLQAPCMTTGKAAPAYKGSTRTIAARGQESPPTHAGLGVEGMSELEVGKAAAAW